MDEILNGSILFRSWKKLTCWFVASIACKILYILLNWYKYSSINRFIVRYLSRNSSLPSSRTFRIFSGIFGFFDKLWDKLYGFGAALLKSSIAISFLQQNFIRSESLAPYSLVIFFFCLGFAGTSLILGTFDLMKAGLTTIGIAAALFLTISKSKWRAFFENSFFGRFATYIFD